MPALFIMSEISENVGGSDPPLPEPLKRLEVLGPADSELSEDEASLSGSDSEAVSQLPEGIESKVGLGLSTATGFRAAVSFCAPAIDGAGDGSSTGIITAFLVLLLALGNAVFKKRVKSPSTSIFLLLRDEVSDWKFLGSDEKIGSLTGDWLGGSLTIGIGARCLLTLLDAPFSALAKLPLLLLLSLWTCVVD